ncbi:fumarylacetoacetate hydrolase family protein [Paraburkholderia dilworthii]|uniref:fumarylacetoacetate hydrolase family protein n=1 Tax=Paraburkholderia dilworthii TaxID=948106 RepID=UPI0003F692D9|nr:fumarylacetoacetate hydrolase family protein [Paraburkholderia dilworthii]
MKLICYEDGDALAIGYVDGAEVVRLADRDTFWRTPWASFSAGGGERLPREGLRLRSPLRSDAKVVCIGLNYRSHAIETGSPIPERPVVFSRWAETVICDGDESPTMDTAYDWEAELGVVIGDTLFGATPEAARRAILGYCTFNDLSARTLQLETSQWTLGKNTDRSGPMGPIVTADEAGDPADGWRVTTDVNGERVQDGITSDLIFDVPTLLAYVSRSMTLSAGDLMITGTPSGVGIGMKPPRYLKPGDVVRVEVEGLGAVITPIVERPQ